MSKSFDYSIREYIDNLVLIIVCLRAKVSAGKRNEQGRLKFKYQQEEMDRLDYLIDDLSCFWDMDLSPYLNGRKGYRITYDKVTLPLLNGAYRGIVSTCTEKLCVFEYKEARPYILKYTWFLKYMLNAFNVPSFVVDSCVKNLNIEINKCRDRA